MAFYQLFHLILHEIDRFGCFMLKSGFFSKSLVLCLSWAWSQVRGRGEKRQKGEGIPFPFSQFPSLFRLPLNHFGGLSSMQVLGYIHTILESFSCRHEKLSDIVTVWTPIWLKISQAKLRSVTGEIGHNHRSYVWIPVIPILSLSCGFRAAAIAIRYDVNTVQYIQCMHRTNTRAPDTFM